MGEVSGRETSDPPHHSVVTEFTSVAAHMGVGFAFGDDDKTFNWSIKNKTDNIIIDSGSIDLSNPPDPPYSNVAIQGHLYREGRTLEAPFKRWSLHLHYNNLPSAKTIELKIENPSETNQTPLTIQFCNYG